LTTDYGRIGGLPSIRPGYFPDLLKPYQVQGSFTNPHRERKDGALSGAAHGTTILAFHYRDGVLVAGDRRATASNRIMSNRVDKVLEIDHSSLLAISGSPAMALEMARILDHSLKYYRRSQLTEISLEGKIRILAQLLKDNLSMAVEGIGAVVPLFIARDPETRSVRIYFYDILGAHFEGVEFSVGGSGSPEVQGILRYLDRWNIRPLREHSRDEAIVLSLRLLETASYFDSATGGVEGQDPVYPVIKLLTPDSLETIDDVTLATIYKNEVMRVR